MALKIPKSGFTEMLKDGYKVREKRRPDRGVEGQRAKRGKEGEGQRQRGKGRGRKEGAKYVDRLGHEDVFKARQPRWRKRREREGESRVVASSQPAERVSSQAASLHERVLS